MPSTDIAGQTPPKSSVQRSIRAAVLQQWKIGLETLEEIWPKKETLIHVKWYIFPCSDESVRLSDILGLHDKKQRTHLNILRPKRTPLLPAF